MTLEKQRLKLRQMVQATEIKDGARASNPKEKVKAAEAISDFEKLKVKAEAKIDELFSFVFTPDRPGGKNGFNFEFPYSDLLMTAKTTDEIDEANALIGEYFDFMIKQENAEIVMIAFKTYLKILNNNAINSKLHFKLDSRLLNRKFDLFTEYFIYSLKKDSPDRYDYSNTDPYKLIIEFIGIDELMKEENKPVSKEVLDGKNKLISYYLKLNKEVKELAPIYIGYMTAAQYLLNDHQELIESVEKMIKDSADSFDLCNQLKTFKNDLDILSDKKTDYDIRFLLELLIKNGFKPNRNIVESQQFRQMFEQNKTKAMRLLYPSAEELGIGCYLTTADIINDQSDEANDSSGDLAIVSSRPSIYSILKQIIYLQVMAGQQFRENLLGLYSDLDKNIYFKSLVD